MDRMAPSHLEPAAAQRGPCQHGEREAIVAPAAPVPPLRTPPVRRKELVTVTVIGTVIYSDGDKALIEVTGLPGVRSAVRVWVGQAEAARV